MTSIVSKSSDNTTDGGLAFFERFKGGFGTVVKATMKVSGCIPILILENDLEETMELRNSCSAGYYSSGSRGTLKVLKECGFDVDREFIERNEEFEITK